MWMVVRNLCGWLYNEVKKVIAYIMYFLDSSMMCLKVIFDLYEYTTIRADPHMLLFIFYTFNRVTVWCWKACHDRLINVRECLTHHNPNSWQKTLIELLEFWSPCIKLLVAIYLNLCLALNRWICKPILWVKYLS